MKRIVLVLVLMLSSCYPDDYVYDDVTNDCSCGVIIDSSYTINNLNGLEYYYINYIVENNCSGVLEEKNIVVTNNTHNGQGYPHMIDNLSKYEVG
jgi:hypothetical protein